jgi:hypothetical protein
MSAVAGLLFLTGRLELGALLAAEQLSRNLDGRVIAKTTLVSASHDVAPFG